MAEIVYTGVTDAQGVTGNLFQGTKFWLSQKVPQRKRFIDQVKANGGEITPLEKEAEVKIVDHAKKEQFPGTYSYQYIEFSVRNGALEDLETHAVGPPSGSHRTVGSIIQPPKSSRTKFTDEDDRFLVNWVVSFEQRGGATAGNEIYKQLEAKNPRHTFQSWRDRWVKYLKDRPRSAFISQEAPPTPPAEPSVDAKASSKPPTPQQARPKPFSKADAETLLSVGHDIMNILPENANEAWARWAEARDNPNDHSRQEWQDFWEKSIRPVYLERKAMSASSPSKPQRATEIRTAEESDKPEQLDTTTLPVRTSPFEQGSEEPHETRSPSYHPESPGSYNKAPSLDQEAKTSRAHSLDGASDARHGSRSPTKRKRPFSEEVEELPSSSPPGQHRSPKRMRYTDVDAPRIEVKATPQHDRIKDMAREIPDTFATEHQEGAEVFDLVDHLEKERAFSDSVDDDENPSTQKSHPVSPELGRSPIQSFNSTHRQVSTTQAMFDDPAPQIDFDLAEPDGGFSEDEVGDKREEEKGEPVLQEGDSEETDVFHSLDANGQDEVPTTRHTPKPNPASDSDSDGGPTPRSSPPVMPTRHNQATTQALLAAETQELDFSLPEPEGGWDAALLPSSPPQLPPSSPLGPDPKPLPAEPKGPSLDAGDELDAFMDNAVSLGYSDDAVSLALKCTGFDYVLSARVLEALKATNRLPRTMRGCWTEEDDADLDDMDARRIRKLEEKHGKEALDGRWAFLKDFNK
ncbi:MAG: hypothetical protein LQ344_000159 [Seirophora lacunosa]|nr:MAG: hypothetical protein LQ344_000159 [Seirophora lacunosa]